MNDVPLSDWFRVLFFPQGARDLMVCFVSHTEEEEDEEEFLETLPTDMMEDDDLQQMTAMARQASFITRDLSSW